MFLQHHLKTQGNFMFCIIPYPSALLQQDLDAVKVFWKNSVVFVLMLVFLNTVFFDDHISDFSFKSANYQPVSLVEFILECFSQQNIPVNNNEADDFTSAYKLPARSRYISVFFPFDFNWVSSLFNKSLPVYYSFDYQQIINFGRSILFNEVRLIVYLWKLF